VQPQAGPAVEPVISRAGGAWRRRAMDLLLVALLAWSAHALWFQARGARHDWRAGFLYRPSADSWRLDTAPAERLRRCLVGLEPSIGASDTVFLWDPANDLYRWRWAAYYLPAREVRNAGPGAPSGILVIATTRNGPPGATLVGGGAWCGLYRLP
jgi:hypothetical protein